MSRLVCLVSPLLTLLLRALSSIQSAGFTAAAPQPEADVEMVDESKLPQEVEDKIVATNQA